MPDPNIVALPAWKASQGVSVEVVRKRILGSVRLRHHQTIATVYIAMTMCSFLAAGPTIAIVFVSVPLRRPTHRSPPPKSAKCLFFSATLRFRYCR
ncbi:hypothetical protein CONLIGDRAFT_679038 [Coniochaeta ligniaria NRRL 30616]|uniref:Uncharacterized protein n=1 Tax=Coniochaeta ligniaria NRRL 30616 TaxID=1408157 RepID=A0A1J7JTF9_9PEZI|nr:hypothetical protein CONLIGDRAFT_679038 [Coniochaeta ligniaria NRRL 30616]